MDMIVVTMVMVVVVMVVATTVVTAAATSRRGRERTKTQRMITGAHLDGEFTSSFWRSGWTQGNEG